MHFLMLLFLFCFSFSPFPSTHTYSELRNLVEPILSRYRWNRRKPCSSLRSSARKAAEAAATKRFANKRRASYPELNKYRVDELMDTESRSERYQDSEESNSDAEELDARIGASDLYRWIVPEFEILNLVPHKRDLRKSEWKRVGNVTMEQATVNTILYIGADQVPDYIVYDGHEGPYATDGSEDPRPLMYMTNSGKHRFRVATNIAPPFVIETTKLDNNTCLTGDICLKVSSLAIHIHSACLHASSTLFPARVTQMNRSIVKYIVQAYAHTQHIHICETVVLICVC